VQRSLEPGRWWLSGVRASPLVPGADHVWGLLLSSDSARGHYVGRGHASQGVEAVVVAQVLWKYVLDRFVLCLVVASRFNVLGF
jgi:hypothetical protein